MLYIILLLILAVLLLGSSAVLGAVGWILGFIVAAIALIWAGITFEISTQSWVLLGLGTLGALTVGHYAIQAKIKGDEAKIGPEGVAAYKKLLAETEAKMRAQKS